MKLVIPLITPPGEGVPPVNRGYQPPVISASTPPVVPEDEFESTTLINLEAEPGAAADSGEWGCTVGQSMSRGASYGAKYEWGCTMGQSMSGSGVHYGAKYEWVRGALWGKV